jgi:hypothetical protein
MRINKNMFTRLFLIALSSSSMMLSEIASAQNKLPEKCPSVQAIMAEKLDAVDNKILGPWVGFKFNSTYDTKEAWGLLLLFESKTNDEQEALKVGIETLAFLHYAGGPEEKNGKVGCYYESNNAVAIAMTPPASNGASLRELKSKFKW